MTEKKNIENINNLDNEEVEANNEEIEETDQDMEEFWDQIEKLNKGEDEKVDFWEYLDELNKDDEELANLVEQIGIIEEVDERTDLEKLADFIRERTGMTYLTSKANLDQELTNIRDDEKNEASKNIDELLKELNQDENYQDIVSIDGDKDIYFYSNTTMTANYAMIALFVEEENLSKTIAEMVRWNGKTYPCPTPLYNFERTPYFYTMEQIEGAIEIIKKDERYEDIGELLTENNVRYLYSTLYMSEKYARALANSTEYGEYGYQ